MTCCQISDKLFSELMMFLSLDAYIDGLVQEKNNSIANTLELCLSCTNSLSLSLGWNELTSIRA